MATLEEFFRDYSYLFCTFTEGKDYDRKCIYCGEFQENDIHVLKGDIDRMVGKVSEERVKEAMLEYKFGGFSEKGLDKYIEDVQAEKARRNKLRTNGDLVKGAK